MPIIMFVNWRPPEKNQTAVSTAVREAVGEAGHKERFNPDRFTVGYGRRAKIMLPIDPVVIEIQLGPDDEVRNDKTLERLAERVGRKAAEHFGLTPWDIKRIHVNVLSHRGMRHLADWQASFK